MYTTSDISKLIPKYTKAEVMSLTKDRLLTIVDRTSRSVISYLTDIQVGWLTYDQLNAKDLAGDKVMWYLGPKQLTGLTKVQISWLSDEDIRLFSRSNFTSLQLSYLDKQGHTLAAVFSHPVASSSAHSYVNLNTFLDMGFFVWADGSFNNTGLEDVLTKTLGGKAGAWNNQSSSQLNLGFATVDQNGKLVFGSPPSGSAEIYEGAASKAASYVKKSLVGKFKEIALSFGGWSGGDISGASTDPIIYAYINNKDAGWVSTFLSNAVNSFGVTALDFDIENTMATGSSASAMNALRNAALKIFMGSNPTVKISYTLAVDVDGFSQATLDVLKSAYRAGISLDSIHLMCMDYTPSKVLGSMANATIAATKAAEKQLNVIGYTATKLNLIVMSGINDETSEITSEVDLRSIVDYAYTDNRVTGIGQWSQNSDAAGNSGVKNGNTSYTWASGAMTGAITGQSAQRQTNKNYDLSWGASQNGNIEITDFFLGLDHVVAQGGSKWGDIYMQAVTAADGSKGFEVTEAFGKGWSAPGQGYIFASAALMKSPSVATYAKAVQYLTQIMASTTTNGSVMTGHVSDAHIDLGTSIKLSCVQTITVNLA